VRRNRSIGQPPALLVIFFALSSPAAAVSPSDNQRQHEMRTADRLCCLTAEVYRVVKSFENIKNVLQTDLFPTSGGDKHWADGTDLENTRRWGAHDYKMKFAAKVRRATPHPAQRMTADADRSAKPVTLRMRARMASSACRRKPPLRQLY
jgi:hypothetical protein